MGAVSKDFRPLHRRMYRNANLVTDHTYYAPNFAGVVFALQSIFSATTVCFSLSSHYSQSSSMHHIFLVSSSVLSIHVTSATVGHV